jgi:hypothetical protein
MSDLDATLEAAVAEAVEPVNFITIAQALCRSQAGGSGKCLCELRFWKKCHAPELYGDMAMAVVALIKRGKNGSSADRRRLVARETGREDGGVDARDEARS